MSSHVVCPVSELPQGQRRLITIDKRSIGVFNVEGQYYALPSICPHQNAPLCEGVITGTTCPAAPGQYEWTRKGHILRCPWHGWEFDITTGLSVVDPQHLRVRSYPVTVENDQIVVHL